MKTNLQRLRILEKLFTTGMWTAETTAANYGPQAHNFVYAHLYSDMTAALVFHNSMLPDWDYTIHKHAVRIDHLKHSEEMEISDNPAHALLLCDIRALIKLEQNA